MTLSVLPRRPSPSTVAIIEPLANLTAAYPLDANPLLDQAVRQVGITLMAQVGYTLNPHDVHDGFVALVDATQRLGDLLDDPDGYLASVGLPRIVEERLRVEADLRAERAAALRRLLDLR